MVTAIFIVLIVIFIIFLFTGTATGKALKTRASGTASEIVAKDASTPDGAKAYYNVAIEKREEDYRRESAKRDQMLGKIQEFENQLRELQKQNLAYSLKTQKYVDDGDDDAAMTYLRSQKETTEKIDTIKTALKELKENLTRQGEVVSELKTSCEELKSERDKAILTLETAETTKSLRATDLSDRTEDKMLAKVREGVQKTKQEADGAKISYDNSAEVQRKRLDKQAKEDELQKELQNLKKNRH